MKIETMEAGMTDGTTGWEEGPRGGQAIGTVMIVASTTTPAEMNASSAEYPRAEVVEAEEDEDRDRGLLLADEEVPDPLHADTEVVTTTLTTGVTTGNVRNVISVILPDGLSV